MYCGEGAVNQYPDNGSGGCKVSRTVHSRRTILACPWLCRLLSHPPDPEAFVLSLARLVKVREKADRALLLVPRASRLVSQCYAGTVCKTHIDLFHSLNFFSCSRFHSGTGSFSSLLKMLRLLLELLVDDVAFSAVCRVSTLVEHWERLAVSAMTCFGSGMLADLCGQDLFLGVI